MFEPRSLANPDTDTLRHQPPASDYLSCVFLEISMSDLVSKVGFGSAFLLHFSNILSGIRGVLRGGVFARSAGCPSGCLSHWWRSVWVSVAGEVGLQTSVSLASTALF